VIQKYQQHLVDISHLVADHVFNMVDLQLNQTSNILTPEAFYYCVTLAKHIRKDLSRHMTTIWALSLQKYEWRESSSQIPPKRKNTS